MNGKGTPPSTLYFQHQREDIKRTAVLIYWTDTALTWLEPAYNDTWNSSPAMRTYKITSMEKQKDGSLVALVDNKNTDRIEIYPGEAKPAAIENWTRRIKEAGRDPDNEWQYALEYFGIEQEQIRHQT